MKAALVVIACAAPLAACNRSPEIHEENVSVTEVAQKVRAAGEGGARFLDPGQWRGTSTIEELSVPGMPAEAQAQMKQAMGRASNASFEYCLTPEEAKKPTGKFFTGKTEGNCRYETFNMSSGKIDAVMRCDGEPSGRMTLKMSGTYAPDSYSSRAEMHIEGGREGVMTMKLRTEGKRIGNCPPAVAAKD